MFLLFLHLHSSGSLNFRIRNFERSIIVIVSRGPDTSEMLRFLYELVSSRSAFELTLSGGGRSNGLGGPEAPVLPEPPFRRASSRSPKHRSSVHKLYPVLQNRSRRPRKAARRPRGQRRLPVRHRPLLIARRVLNSGLRLGLGVEKGPSTRPNKKVACTGL